LEQWQRKVSDESSLDTFTMVILTAYLNLRKYFPSYAFHNEPIASTSLLTTQLKISDEEQAARELAGTFFHTELKTRKLFENLRKQLEENHEENDEFSISKTFAQTPWRSLLRVQLPLPLPDETRFAGMWVLAPQGLGKTTLLHSILAGDIEKDACIILMDSKGDLIEPFLTHPALAGRRIIIGPDNPVGMNPLDIPHADMNKAVDNLEYLFSSLLDYKLTASQSMLLKAVLRSLISAFPNPNLGTFQDIMAEQPTKDIFSHVIFTKYAEQIKYLDPDLQQFLRLEFFTDGMKSRRQEVLQRLRLLLDNDLLRAMLMASSNTFRVGEAMDNGAFIIINNSRAKLGIKGAEFFGRFFIAQVLAAAQQRSLRSERDKKPVYFFIDECYTVVADDERITDVLHECRSQKIALVLAHQETSQVSNKVLSALQNCAIRFAHPDEEAQSVAPSLRMDIKTLRSMKPRSQFGAYVRGLSNSGIVVNVQPASFSDIKPRRLAAPSPRQVTPPTIIPEREESPYQSAANMAEMVLSSPPQHQAPTAETTSSKAQMAKGVPFPSSEKKDDPDPGEPANDWA
ncbi:MAG: hypothetical protein P4L81_00350, partial [Candidatus Pacebacteria bacterium]|nr:hypothetical protein [Candidatus Paceibacterota bacterium]